MVEESFEPGLYQLTQIYRSVVYSKYKLQKRLARKLGERPLAMPQFATILTVEQGLMLLEKETALAEEYRARLDKLEEGFSAEEVQTKVSEIAARIAKAVDGLDL